MIASNVVNIPRNNVSCCLKVFPIVQRDFAAPQRVHICSNAFSGSWVVRLLVRFRALVRNVGPLLALTVAVTCALAQSASPACSQRELTARLRSDDPAYGNAMQLSQTLSDHGIRVKCVLASKMSQFFVGKKGAALYRTDAGDFEALFAFKPEDFGDFSIDEQRQGDRYVYQFRGAWRAPSLDSPRPMYFVKRGNVLFVTRISRSRRVSK